MVKLDQQRQPSHVIFPVAVVYLQSHLRNCIAVVVDCSIHWFQCHWHDSHRQVTGKESCHRWNRNGLLVPSEQLRSSHVATRLMLYSTKQQCRQHWYSSYVILRDKVPVQLSFGHWHSWVLHFSKWTIDAKIYQTCTRFVFVNCKW
jgi:hypothetical protein